MPVSVERLVLELQKLKTEMDAGNLKTSEYDQRLARVVQELRTEGLDADRAKISGVLADLLKRGTITPGVKSHLEKRLGLA